MRSEPSQINYITYAAWRGTRGGGGHGQGHGFLGEPTGPGQTVPRHQRSPRAPRHGEHRVDRRR
jgi:hypothetical protein